MYFSGIMTLMNRLSVSRIYLIFIAIFVVVGIVIEVFVSAHRQGGYFDTPLAKALNLFAYFTIQSNIIIGLTSYLLATKQRIKSEWFWGLRLSGIAAIIITFIVQHLLLSGKTAPGWPMVSDTILHTIVPAMAVVGWLVFGPRGHVSKRIIVLSTIFPLAWLSFTFIRGAIIHWYPYDFLDAAKHGYGKALIYVLAITALFLGITFLASLYDHRFSNS
jgi:hypothetical protein